MIRTIWVVKWGYDGDYEGVESFNTEECARNYAESLKEAYGCDYVKVERHFVRSWETR